MDETHGATIIPFVDRRALYPLGRPQEFENSAAQLRDALDGLSAALQEQQAATQRWREAVATLSANLRDLARDPGRQGGCPGRG